MSEFSRENAIRSAKTLLQKAYQENSPDTIRRLLNTAFDYVKPFNMNLDDLVVKTGDDSNAQTIP